jgi:hypothetical protein
MNRLTRGAQNPARRRLLAACLAAVATAATRGTAARAAPGSGEVAALLRSLPDIGAAAALGTHVLSLRPRRTALDVEISALEHELAAMDIDDVRGRFDELCAVELERGLTVTVRGWRFAASEARLCVIAALGASF